MSGAIHVLREFNIATGDWVCAASVRGTIAGKPEELAIPYCEKHESEALKRLREAVSASAMEDIWTEEQWAKVLASEPHPLKFIPLDDVVLDS